MNLDRPDLVRTIVPMIVGALVTLGARYGVDLDDAAVSSVVTAAVSALYYGIARALERRGSSLPLLGARVQPAYRASGEAG